MVSAIPTLLGAYLWARLAQWSAVENITWLGILPVWGGLVTLVGAVKAWGVQDPDRLITCIHDLAAANVLVGAGLGLPGSWELLLGISAVLGMTTLFVAWTQCQHLDVFDVRSYWRAVPMLVMLLSAAGMPLTIGFPARAAAYWSIFDHKAWAALFLIVIGEALSLSALWRILLDVECVLDPDMQTRDDAVLEQADTMPQDSRWVRFTRWVRCVDWQHETRYGAGAALAIGIVILGVAPRRLTGLGLGRWFALPRLSIWAALLLPIVGGVVLYRARDRVSGGIGAWWPLIRRLLSLQGLYQGIDSVLHYVGTLIWGTTLVVEGEGYMAWVVLVCLVVLLFVISR
jgi:formate hydrogenlyase subunit 3/multisubunit Na+/H+ antiporter MnhD subunit